MTSINQFQFSGLCTLSNFVCLHPSGIRHDRYTNYQIAFPTTTTTSVSAQSPRAYVDNDRRRRSSVGIWHKVDPIFSLVMVKVDGPTVAYTLGDDALQQFSLGKSPHHVSGSACHAHPLRAQTAPQIIIGHCYRVRAVAPDGPPISALLFFSHHENTATYLDSIVSTKYLHTWGPPETLSLIFFFGGKPIRGDDKAGHSSAYSRRWSCGRWPPFFAAPS